MGGTEEDSEESIEARKRKARKGREILEGRISGTKPNRVWSVVPKVGKKRYSRIRQMKKKDFQILEEKE